MRRQRGKSIRRSGVATIEFALVSPIFLLFVFGLFELGRMLMIQQSLTNAAREGCRAAVMATTVNGTEVESAVRNYLQSVSSKAADPAKVRVTVPSSLNNIPAGTGLTVAVELDYKDVTWVPLGYFRFNPRISATQTGRRE